MARIAYLDSFPADNAIEIIEDDGKHQLLRIDSSATTGASFKRLSLAHAYQCVGARDEVPVELQVDEDFLHKTPDLLVLSSSGSGVDVFDVDACTRAGVLVVNQAGANAESVAEHTIAMMLTVLKRIAASDRALRRGWFGQRKEFQGRELYGRTVGIVGLGFVGTRVAQICRHGFNCPVIAYDPYITEQQAKQRHARLVSFKNLCAEADIISTHTPLTRETHHMFDATSFAAMKPDAIFISTSRGSIHDENALATALENNSLYGAGIDVWEKEPPLANHRLLQFANVVTSPHVAGITSDSLEKMAEYAASQLLALFNGEPPLRPVNPEVLDKYYERYAQILG